MDFLFYLTVYPPLLCGFYLFYWVLYSVSLVCLFHYVQAFIVAFSHFFIVALCYELRSLSHKFLQSCPGRFLQSGSGRKLYSSNLT